MTYRFVAHAAEGELDAEGDYIEAGVSEGADGTGFVLLFMCGAAEPDGQDVAWGFDTHCVVTADQGTAYGCVREAVLEGKVLRVRLEPSVLDALGLGDAEIEAMLDAPVEDTARFLDALRRVLAYGRPDALPARVVL
ncbi:Imm10 family immunity protein [Streptomyces sp. ME19-01-6]|uniref:Imm10 family immunity protein n=1 Tax=Streptomyces sp. ME19-01-6 TaxID=3028686 RepID=UPI0029BBCA90|nr:Imm10 family immunity protein [Streptomyces sp. ME19-01-6]MDX3226336.1 Imm10 family immunity protein [Streptomyces sp. ME19-01-6]